MPAHEMKAKEYIVGKLTEFADARPKLCISYAYDAEARIHCVWLDDSDGEPTEDLEMSLLFGFTELFPDENMGFVKEGSELSVDRPEWSYDFREAFKSYLLGSCKGLHEAEHAFGVSEDEAIDLIGESDIECCSSCGWWYEDYDLTDSDGDLVCRDCSDEEDD